MKILRHMLQQRAWITLAVGAVVLLGTLPGCSRRSNKTPDGRTIIRFWQFWTEPNVKAVIEKATAEFEAANPEYKVELTDLTWNDGHQKIVSAFAGGEVPDLLELGSDWIAEFAAANALTDLSSEYARTRNDFVGWPASSYNGRCWALPWYLSTRVLYQNDSIARAVRANRDRPPLVWNELLLWSRYANRLKPRIYGYGVNAAERHRLYKKFLPFLWTAGGDIFNEDGTACALTSPEAEAALDFLVKLKQYGIVEKQRALDDLFISGRLLYLISGDWLNRRIQASGAEIDYSVTLIPAQHAGSQRQVSFAGGEYLTIPRRAAEPLGALKLARHLLTQKNIFNLCLATGCPTPARIDVGKNPYFYQDSIRRVFMQQLLRSKSPPSHPQWVAIEAEIEWGVEQALYGKLSVSDALTETCERIDRILKQRASR